MSAPALLAVAASSLALALPIAGAATALDAASRATGAADSAALAAADATLGWITTEPCAIASEVTAAASVTLEHCDIDRANGQARVSVLVHTMFGDVRARARAASFVS